MNTTPVIGFVCLYVSDLPASVRFYTDAVGLVPEDLEIDPAKVGFYAFKTGEATFALEKNGVRSDGEKGKDKNPVLVQFRADSPDDLELWNKKLEAYGVSIMNRSVKTSYGIITNFLDPDGNKVELLYSI